MRQRLYAPVYVLALMTLLVILGIDIPLALRLIVLAGAMLVHAQAEIRARRHK